MKTRVLAMILAAAMLLNLTACGSAGQETAGETKGTEVSQQTDSQQGEESQGAQESQAPEEYVFTDDASREVTVPGEISRIMPTGSLAQLVLFALAPEMFVGLASKLPTSAQGIYPEEYFDLTYLGQLYGSADLNVEALAAADPQLIIDIGQTMSTTVEDMDQLQDQTGIPAVYISSTLETMPETYRKLGALLGLEERAEELASFCERVYDRTVSIMDQVGDDKVKTLYILGEEGTNVMANGSYHAELLDWLTDNVAVVDNPVSKGTGNAVDMEQIVLWNPDFILFADGSVYDIVAEDPTWSQMKAVADGRYVEVPETPRNWMGMPPGVQRYLSLIWLPYVLYPDYCDYDVKAEVVEFYELFFHCELTDSQYEELTAKAFLP